MNPILEHIDRRRHLESMAFVILSIGIFIFASNQAEANWKTSPVFSVGVGYDDNVTLDGDEDRSQSDTGYGAQAQFLFSYDSQLTNFSVAPMFRFSRYIDNSELDSNDQFLTFDFGRRGQKWDLRIQGDYSNESVRTAERDEVDFDIEDPDENPTDGTGRVFDTDKRQRLWLNPQFSANLTRRTDLQVFGRYLDTTYDDDVSLLLASFKQYGVGAVLAHSLSDKDEISLIAYTGLFESDVDDSDPTTTSIRLGFNRRISERTQVRISAGAETTEDLDGNDETNPVGEIALIHNYQVSRVIASYMRTIDGSGVGAFSVRDTFSLNASRDMSPRLTLSGGIRAYQTSALDSADVSSAEVDYLQFRAAARWNLTRKVSLELDYRFTDIERTSFDISGADGSSNLVSLSLIWDPLPLPK